MTRFYFSGSQVAKLDEKNRFVLPQHMRYGLIERGKLEFTIGLGLGGCLCIYRQSDIEKLVAKFEKKIHQVKHQKFFTLFFSTLHSLSCDKVGRVLVPPILKKAAGIKGEIVIAGVLNKIEIWPKAKYEKDLENFLAQDHDVLAKMTQEAFDEDQPDEEHSQ
jgi:MraZ protein